eukprot:TRINITY_DN12690_c0_g1_i5.p1 TRINITY_DN12690_c0_g1~~TRINITY_DN12690_c0_g1_i5.p1  ORF type:complete len:334 (-),score=58.40 TRINITY_DN12690_c0_g1_i5:310-1311(-)
MCIRDREWMVPTQPGGWRAVVHPGQGSASPTCHGGNGWVGRYAYFSMENPALMDPSMNASTDGMNQHGLTFSGHAFRGGASYTPLKNRSQFRLCGEQLGVWAVTQFKSVAELVEALPSVAVIIAPHTTSQPGLQWAFADGAGGSVVVDYMGGALEIHENSVGVLTNDPVYSWHLYNLDNYVGLSNRWPRPGIGAVPTEAGPVPQVVGHGFNLVGLPGDFSPPSRFVRAYYLREYGMQQPPDSVEQSMVVATGLLNSMHILQGWAAPAPSENGTDYTQFAILKLPALKIVYIRTYKNMQWQKIDLNHLDLTKYQWLNLDSHSSATDVTTGFKSN